MSHKITSTFYIIFVLLLFTFNNINGKDLVFVPKSKVVSDLKTDVRQERDFVGDSIYRFGIRIEPEECIIKIEYNDNTSKFYHSNEEEPIKFSFKEPVDFVEFATTEGKQIMVLWNEGGNYGGIMFFDNYENDKPTTCVEYMGYMVMQDNIPSHNNSEIGEELTFEIIKQTIVDGRYGEIEMRDVDLSKIQRYIIFDKDHKLKIVDEHGKVLSSNSVLKVEIEDDYKNGSRWIIQTPDPQNFTALYWYDDNSIVIESFKLTNENEIFYGNVYECLPPIKQNNN